VRRSTVVPKVAALAVAMGLSFLAGRSTVSQTAAAPATAGRVKAAGLPPAAEDRDPGIEPPSPYGFNQPG
jgi:hypothetical protein